MSQENKDNRIVKLECKVKMLEKMIIYNNNRQKLSYGERRYGDDICECGYNQDIRKIEDLSYYDRRIATPRCSNCNSGIAEGGRWGMN